MKVFIGNDIVDLTHPDISEKHLNTRFLNRVLSASEKADLNTTHNTKKRLWMLWSGKEAAYKVLKKKRPELVFAHAKFVVSIDKEQSYGTVIFENEVLSLRWITSLDWIHCVAVIKSDEKYLEVFEYDIKELSQVSVSTEKFDINELESTYSSQSAGVRNLAKSLLTKHFLEEAKIIRRPLLKKFAPPELYLSEISLKNWDISLSHDGRFVSCAVSKC